MVAWLEIAVTTAATDAEVVTGLLLNCGCTGTAQTFASDGTVQVVGYLPATEGVTEQLIGFSEQLDYAVAHGWLQRSPQVTTRLLDADAWEVPLRQVLPPLPIGDRFLVTLTDEPADNLQGRIVVRLRSLGGFGTGHHPTTRMCVEWLERLPIAGKRVLDIGTGSGILAIAAALLGAAEVIATDIDDAALNAASDNAQRNGVEGRIHFVKSDLLRRVEGQFDAVLSNLLAPQIKDLAWQLQSRRALASEGVWIGSGISAESWDEVRAVLTKLGYRIHAERCVDGWVAFQATL